MNDQPSDYGCHVPRFCAISVTRTRKYRDMIRTLWIEFQYVALKNHTPEFALEITLHDLQCEAEF
jgi:hypothetical protein